MGNALDIVATPGVIVTAYDLRQHLTPPAPAETDPASD